MRRVVELSTDEAATLADVAAAFLAEHADLNDLYRGDIHRALWALSQVRRKRKAGALIDFALEIVGLMIVMGAGLAIALIGGGYVARLVVTTFGLD